MWEGVWEFMKHTGVLEDKEVCTRERKRDMMRYEGDKECEE